MARAICAMCWLVSAPYFSSFILDHIIEYSALVPALFLPAFFHSLRMSMDYNYSHFLRRHVHHIHFSRCSFASRSFPFVFASSKESGICFCLHRLLRLALRDTLCTDKIYWWQQTEEKKENNEDKKESVAWVCVYLCLSCVFMRQPNNIRNTRVYSNGIPFASNTKLVTATRTDTSIDLSMSWIEAKSIDRYTCTPLIIGHHHHFRCVRAFVSFGQWNLGSIDDSTQRKRRQITTNRINEIKIKRAQIKRRPKHSAELTKLFESHLQVLYFWPKGQLRSWLLHFYRRCGDMMGIKSTVCNTHRIGLCRYSSICLLCTTICEPCWVHS